MQAQFQPGSASTQRILYYKEWLCDFLWLNSISRSQHQTFTRLLRKHPRYGYQYFLLLAIASIEGHLLLESMQALLPHL
jgi:hypothetical protein